MMSGNEKFEMKATKLSDGKPLQLQIQNDHEDNSSLVTLFTSSMETASDIVQGLLAEHLRLPSALAKVHIPSDQKVLERNVDKIKESTGLKTHFAANIADSIQNLKVAVVKAEASLMINDITGMRKNYAMVQQENGTLIGEYIKRTNNHQDLVTNLKQMNNMIRFASNCRIGPHQKTIVAESRACIKSQQLEMIGNIFERGQR